MVWARGDLNFDCDDLRTVHNMNVKQGVVLQQLIAKELTAHCGRAGIQTDEKP